MKKIIIGIMPQDQIRKRLLAIAKGDIKPHPGDPRIWFTSMKSLAEVLSDDNRALLKLIQDQKPNSISTLAGLTGRRQSNLSRTLKTMSRYGLVEMKRENNRIRPIVKSTEFHIIAADSFGVAGNSAAA